MKNIISIALIEDDIHYSNTLKKILDNEDNLLCVLQCFTGMDAISKLPLINPDIALVDINLFDVSGIEVLNTLKSKSVKTKYIMCTNYDDDEKIIDALRAGATGYLLKGESLDKIVLSIHNVYNGDVSMTSCIMHKVINQFRVKDNYNLTKTETEVIKLLAEGLSYQEIADRNYFSLDTARKHISNIYRKYGVRNKIEAINKYKGLI